MEYNAPRLGVAIGSSDWPEPLWWPIEQEAAFAKEFQKWIDSTTGPIVMHSAVFDWAHFDLIGVTLPPERVYCTMLMSYLLDPGKPEGHSLQAWGEKLGFAKGEFDHVAFKAQAGSLKDKAEDPRLLAYAKQDIRVLQRLWDSLRAEFTKLIEQDPKLGKLFRSEIRYLKFLVDCRHQGYQLDMQALPKAIDLVGRKLTEAQEKLDREWPVYPLPDAVENEGTWKGTKDVVYARGYYCRSYLDPLGRKLWRTKYNHCPMNWTNWNSLDHKRALLYKAGWKTTKKTDKGEDSCDAASLELHSEQDSELGRMCAAILDQQAATKIYNTYLLNFQEMATPEGILRGNFNQCLTKTGRLSSSEPNLQNLARKGEYGAIIRSLFIAVPSHVFASVDLDQIEFRVLAHFMAKDMKDIRLITPFLDGVDVHEYNRLAWGLPNRDVAKTVVYSILFGGGPMVCGRGDYKVGKDRLNKFHAANPNFEKWKERVIGKARRNGCVYQSMFGRRHYIPALNSTDKTLRGSAERSLISCVLQGTAADVFKLLTLALLPTIKKHGIKLFGPCHDELTMSLEKHNAEEAAEAVRLGLSSPPGGLLLCPVNSKIALGANWSECH